MLREDKPDELKITRNVIRLGDQTYQLRNITRVGVHKIKPKYFFRLPEGSSQNNNKSSNADSGGAAFIGLLVIGFIAAYWQYALLILIVLVVLIVLEREMKPKEYALILETASSSKALLISRNEAFLREISQKIHDYMDDLISLSSYTFDLRQDNSIRVGGDMSGNAVTGDNNRIN
ncbi:DUF6232 family protein [Thermocoleostomius sinensis]|uniref:DUF6232 family protein n=1 Tax=Thermocoleostomius sinensis A174 TaxID=2016057 RepID=A0A9E8ZBQ6_9CYAN|nr:DUF6232 family protein [Thermocoleostomius sinensis]WAL59916.1 DUF6232 family protein [Thermocoleostomius sinensis A174]